MLLPPWTTGKKHQHSFGRSNQEREEQFPILADPSIAPIKTAHHNSSPFLTSIGGNLGLCALGTLLADLCAAGSVGRGRLCFLGLLLGVLLSLLLFALLDVGLAGGSAGLGALRAALLDHVQGGSNDATLLLECAAGTLLGDFLIMVKKALVNFEL